MREENEEIRKGDSKGKNVIRKCNGFLRFIMEFGTFCDKTIFSWSLYKINISWYTFYILNKCNYTMDGCTLQSLSMT